jgi:multidrug resistance efflux pump
MLQRSPKKVAKVRGMNASLAEGSAAALSERQPPRLHITRRQIAFTLLLIVVAAIAAIYTIHSISSAKRSYPASITASEMYNLNFPNNGLVTSLSVTPGQHVKAGQILARQDTTMLAAQVATDEATVKADQAAVAVEQAPRLSDAQQAQDNLQVRQAETALSNAQNELATAQASGQAAVAAAQHSTNAGEALLRADTTRYHQACPNGPVRPDPTLTGVPLQQAQDVYGRCQDLQAQVDRDNSAVADAEDALSTAQAAQQKNMNQAAGSINSAQANLNLAHNQQALQQSGNPAELAQAQATLAQAQSQLNESRQSLQQATLRAPASGIVAGVYGATGEYLGPSGVRQFQGPAGVGNSSTNGFQLFPAQQDPVRAGSSNTGGLDPLIVLVAGRQQVMAEVPESEVHNFAIGRTAQVTISALKSSVPATVAELYLNPARNSSAVAYVVVLNLDRQIPGLLPGMSATVHV